MVAPYVPDPATREAPLQADEVKALRKSGAKALRDARTVDHFLSRVETTIELNRREFNKLHRQVSQISAERQQQGTPTSLDPLSAAKFLPQAELDKLASQHLQAKLAHVDSALAEISEAQRRVTGRVNAIKYAVTTILEEGALDEPTRARFLELVRSLPDPDPEPIRYFGLPEPEPVHDEPAGDGTLDDLFD